MRIFSDKLTRRIIPAATHAPRQEAETPSTCDFARARLDFELDDRQAEVLGARRRRLLLNCSRQWGKSTVTAVRAVFEAETRPGSLTLVAAPTARQSAELVRKAAALTRRLGRRTRGDGQNEISLLFPNGSRVVGLPGSEDNVRGFSAASLVVIDEAARVRDEMYRTLRPMLSTVDGDLWLLSTPHGKRGFFWEEWAGGGPEWTRVSVTAAECPRIRPEFLEGERRSMGEEWMRQEYFCEFVDVNSGLFDRELLERAVDEEIEPLAA
jgi:Terminase large subunit, T4likevirus-type, N-terminal